jgi:hypothetical protein
LNVNAFAIAVRGLHTHLIAIPRANDDFTGIVAEHQARALDDVDRLVAPRRTLRTARPRLDRGLLRLVRQELLRQSGRTEEKHAGENGRARSPNHEPVSFSEH